MSFLLILYFLSAVYVPGAFAPLSPAPSSDLMFASPSPSPTATVRIVRPSVRPKPTYKPSPSPTATLTPLVVPTATPTTTAPPPTQTQASPTTTRTYVDATQPTMTMSGPKNGDYLPYTNVCFPIYVTDNVSKWPDILMKYTFDGRETDWTTDVSPCYSNLSTGVHTFTAQAKDQANNVTTMSVQFSTYSE